MSGAHADPPVRLERSSRTPLTTQLSTQLREAMVRGVLRSGERLPSSRSLAEQLGVSRTVVTEAFQQLYAEGWLEGRHGSGTFVAQYQTLPDLDPTPAPVHTPDRRGTRPSRAQARRWRAEDLRPGAPWVRDLDRAAWRRAWRHAAEQPLDDDPDPRGLPRLRALLAEHLRRARGVRVGPENVLVTRGTGNGLDLIATTLLRPGARAGVEDPGYQKAPTIFAARGARPVPCTVDAHGIVVDTLPADLSVVYTTPAHQYPLGGRLPLPRRERLLAWAREHDVTVVEDDYDAEFRYDVAPLPALYGLDPSRVVLLGTLSKTLSPDMGIGWLVAEPALVERIARWRFDVSDRTGVQAQNATALLLERGDLDRHLRRMRREYARRRKLLVERLGPRLTGDTAGLHTMVPLPAEHTTAVVEEAAEHGVLLADTTHTSLGTPSVHGLILGYGSVDLPGLGRACEVLTTILDRRLGPVRA